MLCAWFMYTASVWYSYICLYLKSLQTSAGKSLRTEAGEARRTLIFPLVISLSVKMFLVLVIPICKNKWEHWLRGLLFGKRPLKHGVRSISWKREQLLLSLFFENLAVFQPWKILSPAPWVLLECIITYKKGENRKDRRMNRNTKGQREIEMDPPENTQRKEYTAEVQWASFTP